MKQKAFSKISDDENIFHNQAHMEDMLTQLNMYKTSIPSIEYKRLFAAICYHDICHDVLCDNNKTECCNTFKRDWNKVLNQEEMDSIFSYIMATDYDINQEEIKDIKYADLIHDLNMISFIDYEVMKNSDIKLKAEYSDIQPNSFYETRINYFKKLIETNVFISSKYKRYNSIALENIKLYIQEMEELLKEFKDVADEKC
jgi:predicted metal-dependent HD superfamily phosphohydrolase